VRAHRRPSLDVAVHVDHDDSHFVVITEYIIIDADRQ
jgi:hypothetical protein